MPVPNGAGKPQSRLLTGAIVLLLAIWIAVPNASWACSCRLEPLDEVFHDSTDVFIAEVIAVRRETDRPVLNEFADYVATFRVTHVYKGDPEAEFELPFRGRYSEIDPRGSDVDEIVVGGCEAGFALDEMRIFLLKGDEPLEAHWCSSRIHAPYRVNMEYLDELAAGYR